MLLLALMAVLVVGSGLYLLYARGAFEPTQRLVLVADDSEGVVVGVQSAIYHADAVGTATVASDQADTFLQNNTITERTTTRPDGRLSMRLIDV